MAQARQALAVSRGPWTAASIRPLDARGTISSKPMATRVSETVAASSHRRRPQKEAMKAITWLFDSTRARVLSSSSYWSMTAWGRADSV